MRSQFHGYTDSSIEKVESRITSSLSSIEFHEMKRIGSFLSTPHFLVPSELRWQEVLYWYLNFKFDRFGEVKAILCKSLLLILRYSLFFGILSSYGLQGTSLHCYY